MRGACVFADDVFVGAEIMSISEDGVPALSGNPVWFTEAFVYPTRTNEYALVWSSYADQFVPALVGDIVTWNKRSVRVGVLRRVVGSEPCQETVNVLHGYEHVMDFIAHRTT